MFRHGSIRYLDKRSWPTAIHRPNSQFSPNGSCSHHLAALQQFIVQRDTEPYIRIENPAISRGKDTSMLTSFIRYVRAWRDYGDAVRELSNLNDRELADLGITRSEIPHIASEQVRH
jgi:uncharacterized protein YjiS (DUF1127 family)